MGGTSRFKPIPEAREIPVANSHLKTENSRRTSISVDAKISQAITAVLLIKNREKVNNKLRLGKEDFVNNVLKKELKKLLKEIDPTTLETLGVDIEYFDL